MRKSLKNNWESFWHEKQDVDQVYSNTERIRKNLKKVTTLTNKKILEIGAGTGRDSLYMVSEGCSLFLLDYTQSSLEIIRKLIPQTASAFPIGGDAFALPFSDRSFDVIFHQGLLEHFRKEDATKLLMENIRVLKPDGYLLVDVPQRYHIYTIIKHVLIFFNSWFAGWEREFSLKEIQTILQALNLEVKHSYGEWMYPSLFYRMFRELGLKIGVKLPLYPRSIPMLSNLRRMIRNIFNDSSIQKNTALSIGVIAQKKT